MMSDWLTGITGMMEPEDYPCTCVKGDPATGECIPCGMRDCPRDEPLHWHHDGCPACSFDEALGNDDSEPVGQCAGEWGGFTHWPCDKPAIGIHEEAAYCEDHIPEQIRRLHGAAPSRSATTPPDGSEGSP